MGRLETVQSFARNRRNLKKDKRGLRLVQFIKPFIFIIIIEKGFQLQLILAGLLEVPESSRRHGGGGNSGEK